MRAERLVFMFCDDTLYSFERANEHTPFTFGGPLEVDLSGLPTGPRPLHMVACLTLTQIPEVYARYRLLDLPLIYGFTYDGCGIRYRIQSSSRIEILELFPPRSCDDFPYENYPPLLPYAPMRISETRRCSYAEFAEEFPNMPLDQPAELIVAVPPPLTLGVSLWGRTGDAEGVTVVFECDLSGKTVRACNRTT